jgi:hypothetical protein
MLASAVPLSYTPSFLRCFSRADELLFHKKHVFKLVSLKKSIEDFQL